MRHISREIFTDEFVGKIQLEFRMLWIGMLVHLADDQGRMLDNATTIRGSIFPYDAQMRDDIIEAGLRLLMKHKKILRYRAGSNGSGRALIQIVNWWKHQDKALTRWAGRSAFPPPPRWIDRIRIKQPGNPTPVEVNWHMQGGFSKSHRTATVRPPSGDRRLTKEEEEKNQYEDKEEEKRIPPSLPPSRQGAAKADGRRDAYTRLTDAQRRDAEQIEKILHVASFSDTRQAVTLSVLVATRSLPDGPIHHVIASFAGAFGNTKTRDPIALAVHMLRENKVPPAADDPSTWRSVPQNILKAAGIDDLRSYVTQWQQAQFERG